MNQIIAAIMLFGIITVVFAPLIVESGSQIFSKSESISDVMDASRLQTGQIIVATQTQQYNGNISVFLSNIGIEDITIHTVLVDGIKSPYTLKNQDSITIVVFHKDEIGRLEIIGIGDTVQIITDSGKLFEFYIQ